MVDGSRLSVQMVVVVVSVMVAVSQLSWMAAGQEDTAAGESGSSGSNIDDHTQPATEEVTTITTVTPVSTVTTTALAENKTATLNTTSVEVKDNTGAIVTASIVALTACFAVVLGVYLFKRRRQFRMQDKEKKMQIQMSSARNAGVYHDLTVSVPTDDKPSASPEQEHLKATEEA